MAQYIDDDGVVWDVVGFLKPALHNYYLNENGFGVRKWESLAKPDRNLLILIKPKKYITTAEEAKAWAKANPDTIVSWNCGSSQVLYIAERMIPKVTFDNLHGHGVWKVQVELGKFIPITEIEVV